MDHLPELEHSTQQINSYLLNKYIEEKFNCGTRDTTALEPSKAIG
jgi:hypothetical protein